MKFNITKHCSQRYTQRVLGGSNITNNLYVQILKDLSSGTNITSKISEKHPMYLLYVKKRYGSDKGYTFIKKDNIIFILTKRKNTDNLYDVLTCYIETVDTYKRFDNSVLTNQEIYHKLSNLKNKC